MDFELQCRRSRVWSFKCNATRLVWRLCAFAVVYCLACFQAAPRFDSAPRFNSVYGAEKADRENFESSLQQKVGLEALEQLRNGNLELALKVLEQAANSDVMSSQSDDDTLGPACAGLNRALTQLDFQMQYDLLRKWSISEDSPPKILHLMALVPTVAPPAEFARALGERPRSSTFPVGSIGAVRGIFSSAWSLVVAARESGHLKRLTSELNLLVDRKIPSAD